MLDDLDNNIEHSAEVEVINIFLFALCLFSLIPNLQRRGEYCVGVGGQMNGKQKSENEMTLVVVSCREE
jgi:hypothetical protein